jgi:hypothetical protein
MIWEQQVTLATLDLEVKALQSREPELVLEDD